MRQDQQTILDNPPRDRATDIGPKSIDAPMLEYAPPEESQTAGWIVVWLVCGACSIVLAACMFLLFMAK